MKYILPPILAALLLLCGCDYYEPTADEAVGAIHVYTADRCPACQMMKPVVKDLKQQGYVIRVVDCDRNPDKAGKARISRIPTFIHYHQGKETDRIVGTASHGELKRMYRPR